MQGSDLNVFQVSLPMDSVVWTVNDAAAWLGGRTCCASPVSFLPTLCLLQAAMYARAEWSNTLIATVEGA